MKTIEELKKVIIDGAAYSSKAVCSFIDQAVSIATKEAIERERERIIGVIERFIGIMPESEKGIIYALGHFRNEIQGIPTEKLSTPQPEVCEWEFIEGEICLLSCQKPHTTNLGALARMTYKFCPFCSKPIKVKED